MLNTNNQQRRFFNTRWFQIGVLAALTVALMIGAAFWFATGVRADTPKSVAASPLGSSLAVVPCAVDSAALQALIERSASPDYSVRAAGLWFGIPPAGTYGSSSASSPAANSALQALIERSVSPDYSVRAAGLWFDIPPAGTYGSSSAPCTAASPLPLGSYTNDKTGYGPLVLTLADGQYTLNLKFENRLIQGTWKVTGDQIQLTETKGGLCPNLKSTYKWTLAGQAVTFTLVQDECLWNTTLFDSQTWVRQS